MEGRFISKDPAGFDGGDVNLYAMTDNNPINFNDPTGLVKWSGTLTAFTAVDGIGAGGFTFDLTSECINNYRLRIKGFASTVAVGAGLKWIKYTGTKSSASFYDDYSTPNPNAANGFAGVISAGAAFRGKGYSFSTIKLGHLISNFGGGPEKGFDFSAGVYLGASTVLSSQKLPCCQ